MEGAHTNTRLSPTQYALFYISLVFITLACMRSALYLYNSQQLPLRDSLYPLHFSPVFHPFTKVGAFENTKAQTFLYVEYKGEGYVLQDLSSVMRAVGGPHPVYISLVASTFYLPRREYFGDKDAAYAVARYLFCKKDALQIVVFSRDQNNRTTNQYAIPCEKNS